MAVHVINGRASKQAMSLHRGHHGRHERATQHQKRNISYHHTSTQDCPHPRSELASRRMQLSVINITKLAFENCY
jgi:hypothetical protein